MTTTTRQREAKFLDLLVQVQRRDLERVAVALKAIARRAVVPVALTTLAVCTVPIAMHA